MTHLMHQNKKIKNEETFFNGFTLIEVLISIGIVIILSTLIITGMQPATQLARSRDNRRSVHLSEIWYAVSTAIRDDNIDCVFPQDTFRTIGTGELEFELFSCIYPEYLRNTVYDPTHGHFNSLTDDYYTGYQIWQNPTNNEISLRAPFAENSLINLNEDLALLFDGEERSANIGNETILVPTSGFTLEAWIFFEGSLVGLYPIFSKNNSSATNQSSYELRILDGNLGILLFNGTGSSINVFAEKNLLNEWNHVAAMWDGSELSLFINGELIAFSQNVNSIQSGNVNAHIGSRQEESFFRGKISEVRFFEGASTAEEIKSRMNKGLTGKEEGVIAFWPLNEGEGDTIYDLSDNEINGTSNNLIWSSGR